MALERTDFQFNNCKGFYAGKVRDVYDFGEKLAMVTTDRISAFDVILPKAIPYKGQVLTQIAHHFLEMARQHVPVWLESMPHPNVMIGKKCAPFRVEMVIRGYLTGHAWRTYAAGKRSLCGVPLPEGLREHDPLPQPIITPTTKAAAGHDQDITAKEIVAQGLVSQPHYRQLEAYTRQLYEMGTRYAKKQGLLLVDTKYEFGLHHGTIYLIDEVHTPDSSRYFYAEGYQERQQAGSGQKQLSKEFVRQWLIERGFQGKTDQVMPNMDEAFVQQVSERYIELFGQITGKPFHKGPEPLSADIMAAIRQIDRP